MIRAERNTESTQSRIRLGVAAYLTGAVVLLIDGQSPLLVDMTGGVGARSGLGGPVGLVGAQLWVFSLDAVLTWLFIVAFNLSLAAWPTGGA